MSMRSTAPFRLSKVLAGLVAIESIELFVWALKSVAVTEEQARELFEATWRAISAKDTIVSVVLVLSREANERAVAADDPSDTNAMGTAIRLLFEMRGERLRGNGPTS